MTDPLILTLALDGPGHARLAALRAAHFPDRGYTLPAHLTLFHHLPGDRLVEVTVHANAVAADAPPLELTATEVLDFGGGVAFRVNHPDLKPLRARLAAPFADALSPQDRSWGRPHVTVQNKVCRPTAQVLLAELRDGFEPFAVAATGLDLWHYRGGPWDLAAHYPFGGIE